MLAINLSRLFYMFMDYILGRQKGCSCYTFQNGSENKMTWPKARRSCEYYNKSLVAMETS